MLRDLNELLEKHRRGEDTDAGLRRLHGQARRLLPREPAGHRRADGRARPAGRRGSADAQLDDARSSATSSMALCRAGVRLARADAVAVPARRQPAARCDPARTGAARRSSGARRGSGSATAPACSRTSPTSTTSPSSSPSPTAARGWTTSTSTSSRASSATQAAVDARTLAELERALHETGYLKRGSDGQLRLSPEGDAPARQGAAAGRRQPDVGAAGAARPASGRCGRRASRRQPRVGVRRHRALERDAHGHQRGRAHGLRGRRPARRRADRRWATSRSTRPRRAPRRRSRCWWTPRSRWRWPAAGCR